MGKRRGRQASHETDPRQARRADASARSARLLDAVFAGTLNQMVILDRAFDFVRVNDAYAEATGHDVSFFEGKNHFVVYPSDAKSIFERVVRDKTAFTTRARPFVFPDHPEWGVTYWDWTLTPILDDDGEVEFLVFMLADVTEHVHRLERLREQSERLAAAERLEAVGHLAAGTAHDLNNLLTAIVGAAHLIDDREATDPAASRYARDILEASERASSLTSQLLAFGREQVLRPKVVDLNRAVRELRATLRHVCPPSVNLSLVCGEGTGNIEVDPEQLERAVLNLVRNAADAMPDGGTVTLMTANSDVSPEAASEHPGLAPGTYVLLSVQDTGIGIDDETRRRIFEPFFTTKPGDRGTGLGLASVYGIVKQSQAEIFVHSVVGAGTTFKIYFPRVSLAAEAVDEPASCDVGKGHETVLVVDDDPIVRRVVAAGLRRFGNEVIGVAGAGEALTALRQAAPRIELVVTDLVMPDMLGTELVARLERPVPIVFMSGRSSSPGQPAADLPPGTGFISKPFSPGDLAKLVRFQLDRRS